jgi:hypothetical protein
MKKHTYSIYDHREDPNKFLKEVSESTKGTAIAVAGFGNIVSSGGKIEEKFTNGIDKDITRILIYLPETVSAGKTEPDFVMERMY